MKVAIVTLSMAAIVGCAGGGDRPGPPPRLDPLDRDRDGHVRADRGGDDCADDDPVVHGTARETCDGRDEDCDGEVDEDFECVAGSSRACGAIPGFAANCSPACSLGPCSSDVIPTCGASAGECVPGERSQCEGSCGTGVRRCGTDCGWGACAGPEEICDGLDNDCDGAVDEGTRGLTTALTPLPWVGSTYAMRAAGTASGDFAVLQATFRAAPELIVLSWVNGDRQPLVERDVVFDDVQMVDDMRLIPAGEGAAGAVVYRRADAGASTVGIFLATVAGIRSAWWVDRVSVSYRISWTGDELVLVSDEQILSFDADGQAISEPASIPTAELPTGDPPWVDDALVLADGGRLVWVDLSGAVVREREMGVQRIGGVSIAPDGLVVAFRNGRNIGLASLGLDGEERWRAEAATVASLEPTAPLSVEDGWIVPDMFGTPGFGGWVVRSDGVPLGDPSWWAAIPVPFPLSVAVATDGRNALQFVSQDGVSVASVGCIAPALMPGSIELGQGLP